MAPQALFSDVSDEERALLIEMLQLELLEIPGEIHHADHSETRKQLHHRRDLVEGLLRRLEASSVIA